MKGEKPKNRYILKIGRETRIRVYGEDAVKKWLSRYPSAEVTEG